MVSDTHIVCQNLSLQFAYQKIFTNLSFELKKSHSLAIVGHNGSGKTTLLHVTAGLLKPTSGHVICCGETIWPKPQSAYQYRHKSLYLGYSPAFYMDQSVQTNLDFYLKCFGCQVDTKDKIETLHTVDLSQKQNTIISNLSTGQKRRLTLAILKLLKPDIVFLDEPTNGLDENGIKLCISTFEFLQKTVHTSFMIATHDDFLKSWCTKSLSLNDLNPQKNQRKQKIHALL